MLKKISLLVLSFICGFHLKSQCNHYDTIVNKISENCYFPRYLTIHTKNLKSNVNVIIMNGVDTVGSDSVSKIKLNSSGTYNFKIISKNSSCTDTQTLTYTVSNHKNIRAYDQGSSLTKYPKFITCVIGSNPDTLTLNLKLDSIALNWRIDFGDNSKILKGDTLKQIKHLYNKLGTFYPKLYYNNLDCVDTIIGEVAIEREPVAGIAFASALGSNQGCVPFSVKFKNNTRYKTNSTIFSWDMGDGTTFESNDDTISHTYRQNLCDGVVKLTAKNKCGTSFAAWNPIQASDKDEALIQIVNPLNCDTSKPYIFIPKWKDKYCLVPDIKYFKWIWDDGTSTQWTTSLDSVKKKFTYGSYNIRFIVRNGCGIDTSKYLLNVIDKPTANIIKVYKDTGCVPYSVTFSTQNKSGENYSWDFGDGKGATGNSVKHIYTSSNTKGYVVRLNVTNRCGNAQAYDTIIIYNKSKPKISPLNNNSCWPFNVKINNTTDEKDIKDLKWSWYFNDSLISISKNIDTFKNLNVGKYNLKLKTSDYCGSDSLISKIEILTKPTAFFDSTKIGKCVDEQTSLINKSLHADSSIWITNEGTFRQKGIQDLKISFKSSGIKTIILIVKTDKNCSDTFIRQIWIRPKLISYFYHDNNGGCGPVRLNFTSKSQSVDSFKWVFDNKPIIGKDTISYFFQGKSLFDTSYNVKLIGWSQGCKSDSFESKIILRGSPLAKFTSDRDTFCFPEKVTFFNQSLKGLKYQWNMGQGLILNNPNPQVYFPKNPNYLKDTTYNVVLTVFGDVGNCISKDSMKVTVKPYPIPSISTKSLGGCSPHTAMFVSNSINSYESFWDFGNGFTSKGDTVIHTFFNRGFRDTSYKVMLRVKSIDCFDSTTIIVPVYLPTVANFDYNRAGSCKNEFYEFTNRSINGTSWFWNFGDGNFSTLKSPIHQFNSSPYQDTTYIVKLISKTEKNCIDSISKPIKIKQKLKVDIKDTTINSCPPFTITFENLSKGATTFIWDFGDGVGSSLKTPTHTYTKTGDYRYKLIAFDENGCKDSILSTGVISIKERPKAIISSSTDEIKYPDSIIYFNDLSLRNLNTFWNFGDGETSIKRNVTKIFNDSGNYKITLISSNLGCSDTTIKTIRVNWWNPIINVEFKNDTQCAPATFVFKNFTKYADKWTWYFGDGNKLSNEKEPKHTYTFGGNYKVSLVAEGNGGKTIQYFNLKVLKSPTSSFEFSTTEYERLYYNWKGVPTNLSIWNVTNKWIVTDFNQDSIYFESDLYEPLIKLSKPGEFTVFLITVSEDGCIDTSQNNIELESLPKIFVPNAFTPNKDRNNEVFGVYISNDNIKILDFDLSIYNRWGEKVFNSKDIDKKWDGTFIGKNCQMGVYVWKLNINLGGNILSQSGTVTLLR